MIPVLSALVVVACTVAAVWVRDDYYQPRAMLQVDAANSPGWISAVDKIFLDATQPSTHIPMSQLALEAESPPESEVQSMCMLIGNIHDLS